MKAEPSITTTPNPGPWRPGVGNTVVCDSPIEQIEGADETDFYGGHMVAESVAPRNLPLIAAAPALLEALMACEAALTSVGGWTKTIDLARSAIAAARGKEGAR